MVGPAVSGVDRSRSIGSIRGIAVYMAGRSGWKEMDIAADKLGVLRNQPAGDRSPNWITGVEKYRD